MVATVTKSTISWHQERTWPTQAETARLVALSPSAISKQAGKGQVVRVYRGIGRKKTCLVPPREVLRLASATGRVPVAEVKRNMAEAVARRFQADVRTLLRELDHMEESPEPITEPTQGGAVMRDQSSPNVTEPRTKAREINLGRILPRVTHESEAMSASLVTALDEVRPQELPFRPGERKAREVNLGKMRPGFRF